MSKINWYHNFSFNQHCFAFVCAIPTFIYYTYRIYFWQTKNQFRHILWLKKKSNNSFFSFVFNTNLLENSPGSMDKIINDFPLVVIITFLLLLYDSLKAVLILFMKEGKTKNGGLIHMNWKIECRDQIHVYIFLWVSVLAYFFVLLYRYFFEWMMKSWGYLILTSRRIIFSYFIKYQIYMRTGTTRLWNWGKNYFTGFIYIFIFFPFKITSGYYYYFLSL